MKKKLREIHGFIECLSRSRIPHTLALTGSAARGELRNNLGKYDYKSDTDILCIIAHNDIASALCCKQKYICPSPLILMSSKALNHPSNAVLSLTIHSLNNELNLSKPIFTNASATEFLAYQLQPLAYYASQLHNSAPQDKRRLYSKIAITCLKLMYLANHADKRTFIYEHELKSHPFTDIDATLVRDILDRALPDDELLLAVTSLESLVMQYPLIAEIASFLASTNLYFSDKNTYPIEIIEAVFLENNRMKKSDALFI